MRSMSDAPHPTDVRVGRLLRERRLELGISQERLGGLLGVTYQQVQKYERGTNRIGSSRLHELCKILGVQANYFFDEPPSLDQPPDVHGADGPALAEPAPTRFDLSAAPLEDTEAREVRELVEAFAMIGDSEIRRRILDLARTLAGREWPPGAGKT